MTETNPTSEQERSVLVIITGGTICMQESPDGLVPTGDFVEKCLAFKPDFNDGSISNQSVSAIDEYNRPKNASTLRPPRRSQDVPPYTYSVLEFTNLIDSSSMDGTHWSLIHRTIASNWNAFDAFVVLHGTDTLAYTASALSFMLGPIDKTVLVTGSQRSMYAPHSDARDNLLDSLSIAASYAIPELGVVFHHQLYRATRVTKVSAFSVAGFTTPNAKPLAAFHHDPWRPEIFADTIAHVSQPDAARAPDFPLPPASSSGPALPAPNMNTSAVAILKLYPGISPSLINTILHTPSLGGLVLETFGAGNIPLAPTTATPTPSAPSTPTATGTSTPTEKTLLSILASAVARGITIVSVTQCLTGSVTSAYESARRMEREGILAGLDMTTEAAYTKLVWLLSQGGGGVGVVGREMRRNLRGELTADFREGQRRRDSVGSSGEGEGRPDMSGEA